MGALKKALQKEMNDAMIEITDNSLRDADNQMEVFESGGTPQYYERTHNYRNSPDTHGVSGGGNEVTSDIYLNDGYDYYTGTFTTPEVFQAAESKSYGIVGTPGTWERIENDIKENVEESFGRRFH